MNFWQWHRGNEAFPKSHLLFRIGLIGQRQNNPSEARREVMKAHLIGSHWIWLDLIATWRFCKKNVKHFFSANRISTSDSGCNCRRRHCRQRRRAGQSCRAEKVGGWYVAQTHATAKLQDEKIQLYRNLMVPDDQLDDKPCAYMIIWYYMHTVHVVFMYI